MNNNAPAIRENKDVAIKKDIASQHDLSVIEQVVMQGNLAKLTPTQRVVYYNKVCESVGLNPLTRPFDYLDLGGKLTLYARKDATEQLRDIKKISIVALDGKMIDDLYIVTAKASTPDGRIDQATGAVSLGNLKGEQRANAIMKAETKAKRRVTLSIAGLGWIDESEVNSIPNSQMVNVDMNTGEILECKAALHEPEPPQVITHDQARTLMKLIGPDRQYLDKVLKFYQIDSLTELDTRKYPAVLESATKNAEARAQTQLTVQPEIIMEASINEVQE